MADENTANDRLWLTERMRLTAFPIPAADVRPEKGKQWWKAVVQDEPEEISVLRGARTRLQGSFGGGKLAFSITPIRLDWNLIAQMSGSDELPEGIQTLGPFEAVKPLFLKLAESWLKMAPPLKRIALGVTLLHPVADLPAANAFLQTSIATRNFEVDKLRDLVYRVNRPQGVSIEGENFLINRLQTWSTVSVAVALLGIDSEGISTIPGPGTIAAQLELDMSTDAGRKNELPKASLVPLLNCFADFGSEIAQKGDIP